ncbi:MAG: SCO family protein [Acidobacteriota bacterium]
MMARFLIPAVLFLAPLVLTAQESEAAAGDVGIVEVLGRSAALDATLKDEEGRDVTLRQILDKPTVLTLNYFRCAGICTPLLNGVVEFLNRLDGAEPGRDFQVVTVSFDPTDTPEIALRKKQNYLKQMKRPFPPSAWRFLTGTAESTKALCDSVGFRFRQEGDQFVHPGAIVFLSPEGRVTRYMYGVTFLPADVAMAVEEARRGQAEPTINKLLAFCYSYDPAGRRYVFNVTRLAGAATLVLAGAFVAVLVLRRKGRGDSTAGAPS